MLRRLICFRSYMAKVACGKVISVHLFLRSRVFRSSSSVEIVKCPREILVQLQCCGYGSIPASCTPYIESETTFVVACISMMSNSIWQHVSRKAATRAVVRSGRSHGDDRACINCGRLQFLSLAQLCLRRERSKFQASFLLFFCLRQRPSHSGTRSANVPGPQIFPPHHLAPLCLLLYYCFELVADKRQNEPQPFANDGRSLSRPSLWRSLIYLLYPD